MDIDFDLKVEGENDNYWIRINSKYILAEEYWSKVAAEDRMFDLADARNRLEEELKNY